MPSYNRHQGRERVLKPTLACTQCSEVHPADMATLRCRRCGAPLDVSYPDEALVPGETPQHPGGAGPTIPLPLSSPTSLVSLGEGKTPCVPLSSLGRALGLRRLLAKLELTNPTGSFKDRGSAVMLSVAKELGVGEVVEDSSGNAGASIAAYAARAGIRAHIFVPASAPKVKVDQIQVFGAKLNVVDGPRAAVAQAAVDYCRQKGLVYASHNLSPYFIEGTKSFAYEIADQCGDTMPDHLVMPVGNGSLFIGAWKGFQELRKARVISKVPKLHLVQARAIMPLVAEHQGLSWAPEAGARTIAGGISIVQPPRKNQVLKVLQASGGGAAAVSDEGVLHWQRLLAEREGIYCEPTSAAAFAGLEALVRQGAIGPDEVVLVPVTGSGLKDDPPH